MMWGANGGLQPPPPPGDWAWKGAACPARGPGLSHTQDTAIRPDGCCLHCGARLHNNAPTGVPASASEVTVTYATIYDHRYAYTLTGRCAHANCGKGKEDHVEYMIGTAPGSCLVDHRSIKPWAECEICHDIVEPKMNTRTDFESYPDDKKWLSPRELRRLEAAFEAWMVGYFRS